MKSALSSKQAEGKLVILKDAVIKEVKTKALRGMFDKLGWSNALIVGGNELDQNFERAARNIPNIDVLPSAAKTVEKTNADLLAGRLGFVWVIDQHFDPPGHVVDCCGDFPEHAGLVFGTVGPLVNCAEDPRDDAQGQ